MNSFENKFVPEKTTIEDFMSFSDKFYKIYQNFKPFYTREDYPVADIDMEIEDRNEVKREIAELARIKKETLLIDTFPDIENFMQNINGFNDLKWNEELISFIADKAQKEEDLKEIDRDIRVSKILDSLKERVDSIIESFDDTISLMNDYKDNYEIKKSAGTLEELEKEIRDIFIDYKNESKNISSIIEGVSILLT